MPKPLVIDRPPRIQPELPFDEIEIPSPPDKGQSGWEQLAQMALPLVTILAFVFMAGGSPSAAPAESPAAKAAQPTGGSGAGSGGAGSAPASEMQSPFGRGMGGMASGFAADGQAADAAAQAAAQQARLRFQTLAGSGGVGELRETVRIVNAGGAPAAPAEAAGGSGLPFGLAAASPFVALLGKMIKDKTEKSD